jgi:hypothetical protein
MHLYLKKGNSCSNVTVHNTHTNRKIREKDGLATIGFSELPGIHNILEAEQERGQNHTKQNYRLVDCHFYNSCCSAQLRPLGYGENMEEQWPAFYRVSKAWLQAVQASMAITELMDRTETK